MALDFVQVDDDGNLTGMRVALQREEYSALLWELNPREFPLLARMGDYYNDASFQKNELSSLKVELRRLHERHTGHLRDLLNKMVRLVRHSIENNLGVEAIAD